MTFMDFLAEQWPMFGLLGVAVTAFLVLESRKGGSTISHHQATRLVNAGEAVIVDVREAAEYKAGHIVDALNLPYANLAKQVDQLAKHKGKQIIVVDKMGQHAGAAGKTIRDNGFEVVRLQGGMVEWTGQNLPVVKA